MEVNSPGSPSGDAKTIATTEAWTGFGLVMFAIGALLIMFFGAKQISRFAASAVLPMSAPLGKTLAARSLLGLRPEHRAILAKGGWLKYVENSIDKIKYVDDFHALNDSRDGSDFWGQASSADGLGVAEIMTKGWTADEIASCIVHEATHLAAYKETGNMSSQEDARNAEAKFRLDLAKARGEKAGAGIESSNGFTLSLSSTAVAVQSQPIACYSYDPQPDISVYELALAIPYVHLQFRPGGNDPAAAFVICFGGKDFVDQFTSRQGAALRHWKRQ